MPNPTIVIGNTVKITSTLRDSSGSLLNVANVKVRIKNKNGTEDYPATLIQNPSVGVYEMFYTPLVSGLHTVKWTVTGSYSGVSEMSFSVQDTIVTG